MIQLDVFCSITMYWFILQMAMFAFCNCETFVPESYSKSQHPSIPTKLTFQTEIIHLNKIDDVHKFFEMDVGIQLSWVDERLVNFTGKPRILYKSEYEQIWKPNPYIYRSRSVSVLNTFEEASVFNFNPKSSEVSWWVQYKLQLDCEMSFYR